MKPVRSITGPAAALPQPNIDTDVIIRIEHLARCPKEQLGRWCFGPLRFEANGEEKADFILNRPGWRAAPILVAGPNFGCGSSREHAVWALQGLGVACVIAPSFGDIFYANCFQNGLLPVVLEPHACQALTAFLIERQRAGQAVSLTVDLAQQTITWPGASSLVFAVPARRRQALMAGLDAIGASLEHEEKIASWQAADRKNRPWVWCSDLLVNQA